WADFGSQKIQRANVDGSQVEDLATGLSLPVGIAVVTTADPPSPSFTEYPLPSPNSHPRGITVGVDGNLWFAEDNKIGRMTIAGVITEFSTPTSNSNPLQITAGPDGNLWFT